QKEIRFCQCVHKHRRQVVVVIERELVLPALVKLGRRETGIQVEDVAAKGQRRAKTRKDDSVTYELRALSLGAKNNRQRRFGERQYPERKPTEPMRLRRTLAPVWCSTMNNHFRDTKDNEAT